MAMTPEEFERLKQAEKEHLRKMRALKQQYRQAKRKKGVMNALQGIIRPDLDNVHDEMVDKLTMQNIESEARFEVAMENAGVAEDALEKAAREEAEREELRKAEAAELVRQMKLEAGGEFQESDSSRDTPTTDTAKTIGRVPPPDETDQSDATGVDANKPARGEKTIGRG